MNGEDNFITKVVPFKELRMYTESQLPYILETNKSFADTSTV